LLFGKNRAKIGIYTIGNGGKGERNAPFSSKPPQGTVGPAAEDAGDPH
jgi:hypothetical protein